MMLPVLANALAGRELPVVTGIAIAAVLAFGVQTLRLSLEERSHERDKTAWAQQVAAAESKARVESERRRTLEGQMAARQKEIENEYTRQIAQRDRDLAASRDLVQRLRVAAVAADDQCRARPVAGTLDRGDGASPGTGLLLATCASRYTELAGIADRLTDQVRLLQQERMALTCRPPG